MQTHNLESNDFVKEVGSIQNRGFVVGVTIVNRDNNFCALITAISGNIFDCCWVTFKTLGKILNSDINSAFDSNVAFTIENLLLQYRSLQDSKYLASVDKDSSYRTKCMAAISVSNGNILKQLYLSIIECATDNMYLFEIEEVEYPSGSARNAIHAPSKCQVFLSNDILNRINRSPSVEEVTKMFCDAAIEILRYSCRVMTIKFLNDGSGKVISEVIRDSSKGAAPPAFGKTLFPDIFKKPEHYKKNRWRFVYDIDDCDAVVYSSECDSLDLSMSKFVTASKSAKVWVRSLGVRSVIALFIEVNDDTWGVYTVYSIDRLVFPTCEQCVLLESIAALSAIRIALIAREYHFARMAHNVRNPLRSIVSALQILKSETSGMTPNQNARITNCADIIDCAVKSSEVIMDVFNDSIIVQAHPDTKNSVVPIKLHSLLSSVVQHLKPLATRKSLQLELIAGDICRSTWRDLVVLGEEFRIVQIANKFLSNAIKFTAIKGSVTMRLSYLSVRHVETLWNSRKIQYTGSYCDVWDSLTDQNYQNPSYYWVVLEVEDTGCGVSKANMQIMFEPFERLSGAGERHSQLQGDGLGLHIVKTHVEAMSGTLCVASTEGSGTLMFCAFPASQANAESANIADSNALRINALDRISTLDTYESGLVFDREDYISIPESTQTEVKLNALPTATAESNVGNIDAYLDLSNRNVISTTVMSNLQNILEVGVIQNHGFVIGLKVHNSGDIRVVAVNQEILQCPWVKLKTLAELLNSNISSAFDSVVVIGLTCLLFKKQSLSDCDNFADSSGGTASLNSSRIHEQDIIMRADVNLLFEDLHLILSIVNCSTPDICLFEICYIVESDDQNCGILSTPQCKSRSCGCTSDSVSNKNSDPHTQSRMYHMDITSRSSNSTQNKTVSLLDITGTFCDTAMEVVPSCDRVWALRMLGDGSAEIIDERIRDTVDSYTLPQVGKKYPSSIFNDNELYLSSGFRITHDVEKPHSKVLGYNIEELDLRKCKLCIITEAGLSMCRQMSIRSSLAISIQVNGRLWGLYALHSINRPMLPTYGQCVFLEAVGSNSALRIASATREEFISHMSHELRTPIHGITCALQILQSSTDLLSHNDLLDVIDCGLQSSQALGAAVNDILTIARSSDRRDKVFRPFNIYDTIVSTMLFFESTSREKSIQFEQLIVINNTVEFHKRAGLTTFINKPLLEKFNVLGDANRKSRVLHNILNNSFKFTPAEGSVILRVSCVSSHQAKKIWELAAKSYEGSYIASALDTLQITSSSSSYWLVFEVLDTGCGIIGVSMKMMFDAYQQLSSGVCKSYQGIGLGLHMARLHTDMMGGVLGVTSTIGVGSLFYCAVPVQLTFNSQMTNTLVGDDEHYFTLTKKRPITNVTKSLGHANLNATDDGAAKSIKVPCIAFQLSCSDSETQSSANSNILCNMNSSSGVVDVITPQLEESRNSISTRLATADCIVNGNIVVSNVTSEYDSSTTSSSTDKTKAIFLVVDDSLFNLKLLTKKIELSFGKSINVSVECITATNGSIAVEMYKSLIVEGKHRLLAGIFMDYHMPICDGAEATALIRAIELSLSLRRVHIIAFTADVSEASNKSMLEKGADEVMPKPTPSGLVESICQQLVQTLLHETIGHFDDCYSHII